VRKNVKGKGIGRKQAGMYAALSVPKVGKTDVRGISEVWQWQDLGGGFLQVWQPKGLASE
jgi:hypothetical protein